MAVEKHFVKVLFPFQYDKTQPIRLDTLTRQTGKGNEHPVFVKKGFENADLRKGLSDLFSTRENKSKIMTWYQVKDESRTVFGLPKGKQEYVDFYCRANKAEPCCQVAIEEENLYLFESGIGFVELEIRYRETDVSGYPYQNYFISEITDERNYFLPRQKNFAGGREPVEEVAATKEPEPITVKKLLDNVIAYIPGVTDFYTGNSWEKAVRKGLIYSFIYLDEEPEDFPELLFRLRMNYKDSYKVPEKDSDLRKNKFVLQNFSNSYWGTSCNAAVNVSIRTEDQVTNDFFESQFASKMKKEYFVLFMAALHQRFVLMKLMYDMGELDRLDSDYKEMKRQLKEARKYQAEAANLKFRDFFQFPSYVQHVNTYYDLLCDTFCITELYKDLSQDMKNVEEICKVYVEKIKKYESVKKDLWKAVPKAMNTLLLTAVGCMTLMNESWSLLESAFGIPAGTMSIPVLLVTAVLAVPSVISIIETVDNVKELWKTKRESEKEIRN